MTPILFHANCPDGFASFWVAQRHIKDAEPFPMNYGDPTPIEVVGNQVFMLDFCLPADQLTELLDLSDGLVLLDHHETSIGYVADVGHRIATFSSMEHLKDAGADEVAGHVAVLDMERSGVGLTMEWFNYRSSPWLLNIEDRDLWRFKYPETPNIFAAVTARPYTIDSWNHIDRMTLEQLHAEGYAINSYRDQMIAVAVEAAWVVDIPAIGTIPITPCLYAIGSDVAGKLAATHPSRMAGYFMVKQNSVRFGLRSREDGPNVAVLAEAYGGGGHPGASGFEVSREEFASWS